MLQFFTARRTDSQNVDSSYDVVVIGSGPNGLAAAIVALRCGLSTLVLEASATIGGGTRSAELTLPGFTHDVCSAVHPMAMASTFFRKLPLSSFGLKWIAPPSAAAHPLDRDRVVLLKNSLQKTAELLGPDRGRYLLTVGKISAHWKQIADDILGPIRLPSHPVSMAGFGMGALMPANLLAKIAFSSTEARALFAGCAAHSIIPFSKMGSSAIGLVLSAVAHVYGWPIPSGGSRSIGNALHGYVESLGGKIVTGFDVQHYGQLPQARVLLFDTSPRAMAHIMADRMPFRYRNALERYPYGPGVFKIDWALSRPIPWKSQECLTSATVHVGGTLEEIAGAEHAVWTGRCSTRPFVLVTQPSLFDSSRAPSGKHTAWGYCHVPNGCDADMTQRIENQMERFAPGFRDVVLDRAIRSPAVMERENPNLVGGDVGGGSNELINLLLRPTWRAYATPTAGVYLCSAATPPGGGVHGMCGFNAAMLAVRREFGMDVLNRSGLTSDELSFHDAEKCFHDS